MDVVNLGRSRRFLRERPIRVTLFDRARLICDLICLEAEQRENRRTLDASDSLYVVLEGQAHIRVGAQIEELEEQDAVLVPPGVEHLIENRGSGRLTVLAMITPKPTRATEVRIPAMSRPQPGKRAARPPRQDEGEFGPGRAGLVARSRPSPQSGRQPMRRAPGGERNRRDAGGEGPVWMPRQRAPWRGSGTPSGRGGNRTPSAGALEAGSRREVRRGGRPSGRSYGSQSGPRRRGSTGFEGARSAADGSRGRGTSGSRGTGGRPARPQGGQGSGGRRQAGGGSGAGARPTARGGRRNERRGRGRSGPRT
jgi:mannose-6-phosphate isomerase-like protein (cupin superfamily)